MQVVLVGQDHKGVQSDKQCVLKLLLIPVRLPVGLEGQLAGKVLQAEGQKLEAGEDLRDFCQSYETDRGLYPEAIPRQVKQVELHHF